MALSDAPREPVGSTAVRAYGNYYLVRKLAEGGMAEIFLAKQMGVEGFEKNVVIKRMLPHLTEVPDFVTMFLDEARLAATLNHPNIVQISDLGLVDGCYYICMEYLAGEDFSTVLRTARRRNQSVPLHVALKVLSEAAHGLHYAHEFTDGRGRPLNIVHRDISPANIFVTYNGQVKVLDFGIAKAETRATQTTAGVVKGKYQYMSPEQAQTSPVDRRADVYSLGVSMYEALTGTRPFARDTDLAILNAVLKNEYTPVRNLRPDLPVEVETIVMKAMAFKPEERYQTAAQMAADLERFLGANTSASGRQALALYMTNFFGDERVKQKTRIDSLTEMAAVGVDVPGLPNPKARRTDPNGFPPVDIPIEGPTKMSRTPTIGAPKSVVADRRKKGLAALVGVLALGVGIGGTVFVLKPWDQKPQEPPRPVVIVPVVPPAVVDAGAVAPPVAEVVDAGAAEAPDKPVVRAVTLTEKSIVGIIQRNGGGFQRCFKTYKADLPAETGKFVMKMSIARSGKVTDAQAEPPSGKVAACLVRHAKAIKFPANTNGPFDFGLPLKYQVKGGGTP